MRLPDFLAIGTMKAGSTTLYYDLLAHRELFLTQHRQRYAEQASMPTGSASSGASVRAA